MEASDCPLVPLLAGSDCQWHSKKLYFPYIPTCLEGALRSVGCQERHEDNKLGLRGE